MAHDFPSLPFSRRRDLPLPSFSCGALSFCCSLQTNQWSLRGLRSLPGLHTILTSSVPLSPLHTRTRPVPMLLPARGWALARQSLENTG
jgi:hypothetical protein